MKTVMHSLNDLRVLLSDPFTQVYVLEALREDKYANQQSLEVQPLKRATGTASEVQRGADLEQAAAVSEIEQELGFQNIKSFLKALVDVMVLSHSSSLLAEHSPNSQRLCLSAFKVAKIVLSQFVSDKQQIREAETSKILQEMMLEILVEHLERVCGLQAILQDPTAADIGGIRDRGGLAKALEDTNLEEIV
jgi:hypothetical protein